MQFVGNRPDVADLLRATDVLALTSTYEGLSNTILEAMSAGLPVVSTAYAGVEELVTDGQEGFVVAMGDCDALVRKFVQLLDDEAMRMTMGERGKQMVAKRFTIPAMATRLFQVYEEAYARTTGAAAEGAGVA